MKSNQGFTLIELMVVVSIIGILASIALPNYQDYIVRTQILDGISIVDGMKKHIKGFYEEHGRFPMDNLEAGIPEPDKLIGNYVQRVTLENGAFHIVYGFKANKLLQGKILTIRPAVVVDSPLSPYTWLCGNDEPVQGMTAVGDNQTDVERGVLPHSCRARALVAAPSQ